MLPQAETQGKGSLWPLREAALSIFNVNSFVKNSFYRVLIKQVRLSSLQNRNFLKISILKNTLDSSVDHDIANRLKLLGIYDLLNYTDS